MTTDTTFVTVINVAGIWKFAGVGLGISYTPHITGTLSTGIRQCVGAEYYICMTKTATNYLTISTGISNTNGAATPYFMYTVYGP